MPTLAAAHRLQQVDKESLQTLTRPGDLGFSHARGYQYQNILSILNVVILEQYPHLADHVVVIGVKAGGRDLHSAIEDKKGMRRFPLLAANHVKGDRRHKVLHLSVVASAEKETGIILHFKPKMFGGMRLYQGVPGNGAPLRGDLARRHCAAQCGFHLEVLAEAKAACQDRKSV